MCQSGHYDHGKDEIEDRKGKKIVTKFAAFLETIQSRY